MTVRAKFKCVVPPQQEGLVVLEVVTYGSEENKEFFRYTPFGRIELGTVNPEAFNQFEIGREYYVDFTPAS